MEGLQRVGTDIFAKASAIKGLEEGWSGFGPRIFSAMTGLVALYAGRVANRL
jgi:hypothetical protein